MKVLYSALLWVMFVIGALMIGIGEAQAAAPGAIAFVGYNADGTDGFAFVLLSGATANAEIFFTDNEWDGSNFNNGEGVIAWQAPATPLAAGTVVTLTNTSAGAITSHGTISGTINLNGSNEVLYAFQGANSSTPSQFLAAIANNSYAAIGSDLLLNTGLTIGTTAVEITGNEDVMVYSGATSFANEAAAHSAIGNAANWATEDGTGDQSQNAVIPDTPEDVVNSMTIAAPTAVTLTTQTAEHYHTTSTMTHMATLLLLFITMMSLRRIFHASQG